jgi:hypothetical protein
VDRVAKAIVISLIATSALVWIASINSTSATSTTGSEDDPTNDMTMLILNNTANSNTKA